MIRVGCATGSIEMIEHVLKHTDVDLEKTTYCKLAAKHGRLEDLMYLHDEGCKWDEGTCADAAKNGHLDCLEYAHKNRCLWDEDTCDYAARNGHLDCLEYAIENGCPYPEDIIEIAGDHIPCVVYLKTKLA